MTRNTFAADALPQLGVCGLAIGGLDSGVCRDRECGRRAPTLIAGYCLLCAPKHGQNPLRLKPDDAGTGCEASKPGS